MEIDFTFYNLLWTTHRNFTGTKLKTACTKRCFHQNCFAYTHCHFSRSLFFTYKTNSLQSLVLCKLHIFQLRYSKLIFSANTNETALSRSLSHLLRGRADAQVRANSQISWFSKEFGFKTFFSPLISVKVKDDQPPCNSQIQKWMWKLNKNSVFYLEFL